MKTKQKEKMWSTKQYHRKQKKEKHEHHELKS